ncbi:ERCC4-type nuclease [Bacillus thuringiensis serovar tolworthi]|uniref:ERCC4-type nuclease n=1 Tax=Bacillus thuringiensis subsp. tolworthi TaxID=1442 RepID=A0A9W3ZZR7_BACTO|nr:MULTISPECIES: ERCC4 domain-containing protein [Bacillus cereus group]MEB8716318.1 ERCC4 domain-containing protein [Bacillus cereus]MRB01923.1 nuclease [Bacillus thuringiensis]MEB9434953.1 ERCC4 domain-containing protein [Bacillus cereus]MEB9483374.1 ERCC4 domain-containing protein [Bacillus cereus]MEB9592459.1 ERCC4 domain-containing protein [Bacillus cereus]
MIRFHYTDKEINNILKTLTIVIDTREKQNQHIRDYLVQKEVPVKIQKLNHGDYSCMVPKNEELGISRDIYLNSFIERKNGVDEITGNLQKDTQQAFINELIRAQESKFVLFVEEPDFDEKIAKGMYRSRYDPKALKGRLESLKAKYNFEIVPMSKNMIGHNIYHRFYYQAKYYLKTGAF